MTRFPLLVLAASLALGASGSAQQLLEHGSFEWPVATKRKARAEGADLSKSAMSSEWVAFRDKADPAEGRLILGLTNEISHSGRQSVFVHFDKLTKKNAVGLLSSDLIPVVPNTPYKIGLWGRVDKQNPVALDTRIPLLRLRIDWFKAGKDEDTGEDAMEQAGEPEFRAQALPGAKTRKPFFTSSEWRQFWGAVTSPADAQFVKITWTWETSQLDGETNGVMYFDDATIEGAAAATAKADPFADDPEIQAQMKAIENDPDFVKPDPDQAPIDVTPLAPPSKTVPAPPPGQ